MAKASAKGRPDPDPKVAKQIEHDVLERLEAEAPEGTAAGLFGGRFDARKAAAKLKALAAMVLPGLIRAGMDGDLTPDEIVDLGTSILRELMSAPASTVTPRAHPARRLNGGPGPMSTSMLHLHERWDARVPYLEAERQQLHAEHAEARRAIDDLRRRVERQRGVISALQAELVRARAEDTS